MGGWRGPSRHVIARPLEAQKQLKALNSFEIYEIINENRKTRKNVKIKENQTASMKRK